MATLADFRLRISAKLGLDNTVAGDQPLIDSWVNEGVAEALTRSRVNVVVGTMALTSGAYDYTLPTGILALDDLYLLDTAGVYWPLYRRNPGEILDMRTFNTGSVLGPVRYYAQNGSSLLMVYPTPSDASTITIYYVPRPVVLSGATDTPSDLPSEWHKVVEYYGLWQGAQFADDMTSKDGEVYRALYEDELTKLKRAALHRGGRKLSPAVVGRGLRRSQIGSPSQQDV